MMLNGKTIAAATFGATFLAGLASWQALGWWRPLGPSDLEPITRGIEQATATAETALALGKSNNIRILQNDWWRYDSDIEEMMELITERPSDRRLRDSLRRLRREQKEIQNQIDLLER
ncbi:MAG: hypothetical protein ACR2QF_02775 [Geminicoccaceae bacterium]